MLIAFAADFKLLVSVKGAKESIAGEPEIGMRLGLVEPPKATRLPSVKVTLILGLVVDAWLELLLLTIMLLPFGPATGCDDVEPDIETFVAPVMTIRLLPPLELDCIPETGPDDDMLVAPVIKMTLLPLALVDFRVETEPILLLLLAF